ncbi:hypothetical protein [Tuwongella immobilis]|uniref:Uncharacterized protein n=1 Tax=Tuwongella immobilis TaxID=692036 RepID=A0A6C2YVA2_9BACT|nr:hypothetical protein [Tuwongella immobilis]VIP05540.1 unnamed protein product [Tuwongella immobilis]VTS08436.1 unnamed protein product [Tuwongella immobilis]
MDFCCDPWGFPQVILPGNRAVGLWPLLKVQYEHYLGCPGVGEAGEQHYAQLVAVSPRRSWRTPDFQRWEELALTGVIPEDLVGYCTHTGGGARLLTAREWREFDQLVTGQTADPSILARLMALPRLHPAAAHLLRAFADREPEFPIRRLAGLERGILEWVRHSTGPGTGLYGRPREGLLQKPIILNPQIHEPMSPFGTDRRRAFGIRIIRAVSG